MGFTLRLRMVSFFRSSRFVSGALLLLCAVPLPVRAGSDRWTSRGPYQANIAELEIDPHHPSNLFAGTHRGVFKSVNEGASWFDSSEGMPDLPAIILALAFDPISPDVLYAAIRYGPVLRSVNGGESWTRLPDIPLAPNCCAELVTDLAIDPFDPSTLYAATVQGVFKSVNGGSSWFPTSLEKQTLTLELDPKDGNVIYAGTAGTSGNNLFKTINGGVTWTPSELGPSITFVYDIELKPGDSSVVYAGTSSHGIFRSSDSGRTWAPLGDGEIRNSSILSIAVSPSEPDRIYAGTHGGVIRSFDAGGSWTSVRVGTDFLSVTVAVDPSDSGTVYAGHSLDGAFKSTDSANSWNAINRGLSTLTVPVIETHPLRISTVFAGTTSQPAIFQRPDDGETWAPSAEGILSVGVNAIDFDRSNPEVMFAGGFGVSKSMDGGRNWVQTTLQHPEVQFTIILSLAVDPGTGTVYAGMACCALRNRPVGGVFRSSDGGQSWAFSSTGFADSAAGRSIRTLAVAPRDGAVFAGTDAGVYKSTSGGLAWTATGLPEIPISDLQIHPVASSTLYAATLGQGVFRSRDGGATWESVSTGLTNPDVREIALDPVDPNRLFAATLGSGVFQSRSGGASWTPLNDGLANLYVVSLAIDGRGTTLHAGTDGRGVFDFTFLPNRSVISTVPRRPPSRTIGPRF